MSRRVNPVVDRATQNQQTIKALLKLEGNKICADCKRNKHPRWASWNIGIFVCIRCSGIHRGMGTHISRVKSVDLDSWTDEQLQSVLKWGNSRGNKYWEAKLAAGHVPSEAKIENFIRTKYESKRWVMDGPMPDPSTLDVDGDDDVPLNIVQEKAKIARSTSQTTSSALQPPQPSHRPTPNIDLFGDDSPIPPVRPSTADTTSARPAVNATAVTAAPKQKPGDSLLGLDFFGNSQASSTPARPISAASNPIGSTSDTRTAMKQSILSLYSSASKPQASQIQSAHDQQPSFSGVTSTSGTRKDAFGDLTEAFVGLNFPATSSTNSPPPQTASSAVSGLGSYGGSVASKSAPSAPKITSPAPLSGGNFFDSASSRSAIQTKPFAAAGRTSSGGLDFSFTQNVAPAAKTAALPVLSNQGFADDDFAGFALASPALPPVPPPTKASSPVLTGNIPSAFNLSATGKPTSAASKPSPMVPQNSPAAFDPWSAQNDSNAWSTPESAAAKKSTPIVDISKPPPHITPNDISGGWRGPPPFESRPAQSPTITADKDFGGWTSASISQTPGAPPSKSSGGFGGPSDPFDNPWG